MLERDILDQFVFAMETRRGKLVHIARWKKNVRLFALGRTEREAVQAWQIKYRGFNVK